MGESDSPQLTGFATWTANDYSNFVTICAAAVGIGLLNLPRLTKRQAQCIRSAHMCARCKITTPTPIMPDYRR
eukprot:COSAG03_NODE_12911_length_525_cov_1.110329_1_plen_72_part_10